MQITVEQQAVVCWCGLPFSVPTNLYREYERQNDQKAESMSLHCPLGHSMTRGVSNRVKDLQDQLTRTRAALDQVAAHRDRVIGERDTARRKLARVHKGTCPECHRSFKQLGRHMATKHPGAVCQTK